MKDIVSENEKIKSRSINLANELAILLHMNNRRLMKDGGWIKLMGLFSFHRTRGTRFLKWLEVEVLTVNV